MDVILCGCCGKMGKAVAKALVAAPDLRLAYGVDPAGKNCYTDPDQLPEGGDGIIDFSSPAGTEKILTLACRRRIPAVIGTTGHSEKEKEHIARAAKLVPVFFAPNFSPGTALLVRLCRQACEAFPHANIEITETHGAAKADAPSGTALILAENLKKLRPRLRFSPIPGQGPNRAGIHSLRLGNEPGTHTVIFSTPYETVTLQHRALSRRLYAEGALTAFRFLLKQSPGLYGMQDLEGKA